MRLARTRDGRMSTVKWVFVIKIICEWAGQQTLRGVVQTVQVLVRLVLLLPVHLHLNVVSSLLLLEPLIVDLQIYKLKIIEHRTKNIGWTCWEKYCSDQMNTSLQVQEVNYIVKKVHHEKCDVSCQKCKNKETRQALQYSSNPWPSINIFTLSPSPSSRRGSYQHSLRQRKTTGIKKIVREKNQRYRQRRGYYLPFYHLSPNCSIDSPKFSLTPSWWD